MGNDNSRHDGQSWNIFLYIKRASLAIWRTLKVSYGVLIVGSLLILYSSGHVDNNSVSHHLTRDVGIAFIVAFLVIITIERVQRNEFNEYITKSLAQSHTQFFEAVYGVEFPKSIWDFIRDRIMREPFLREDTHVFYTIELPNPPVYKNSIRLVHIIADRRQIIRNLTGRPIEYKAASFTEKNKNLQDNSEEERPEVTYYVDHKILSQEEQLKADEMAPDTQDFVRHLHTITIPARKTRHLRVVTKLKSKLITDTEIWRSTHSCTGITYTINFPKELHVRANAIHVDGHEVLLASDTLICCRINSPLLPHNGFVFWWSPTSAIHATASGTGQTGENSETNAFDSSSGSTSHRTDESEAGGAYEGRPQSGLAPDTTT